MTSRDASVVRSGARALKLVISNPGTNAATAWAYASQKMFCIPYTRVHASAWFQGDPDCTSTSTVAQLRLEYYRDEVGSRIIPGHAAESIPFVPAGYTGTWQQVTVSDRVPEDAKSLVLSIILVGRDLAHGEEVEVWVDDVDVTVSRSGARKSD